MFLYELEGKILKIKEHLTSLDIDTVAIYGAGTIGKYFYEKFNKYFKIKYFIDEFKEDEYFKNIPIIKISQIREKEKVDGVLVTVLGDKASEDIIEVLSNTLCKTRLFSVNELIKTFNKYELKEIIQDKIINNEMLRIMIGSGNVTQKGFISTDKDTLNLLNKDEWKFYFKESSIDAILSEHVFEHFTIEDLKICLRNCFEYLKPGGYIRAAVPDGYHIDKEYIKYVMPGGTGIGSDDHKILYNYKSFCEIFIELGYKVNLLEYFDECGEFVCKEWKEDDGLINRSKAFDNRNLDRNLKYTSIIIDAYK